MTPRRLLIAGIGNIFLGDDAFGVEVAQKLLRRSQPAGVQVFDFGIRGLDLTYALLENWDGVILVDALPRGEAPGTLYVIEPEIDWSADARDGAPMIDVHSMDPVKVLRAVAAMGGRPGRVLVVGCEPGPAAEEDEMQFGMSEPVQAAVDEAVLMVESLVQKFLSRENDFTESTMPRNDPAANPMEVGICQAQAE